MRGDDGTIPTLWLWPMASRCGYDLPSSCPWLPLPSLESRSQGNLVFLDFQGLGVNPLAMKVLAKWHWEALGLWPWREEQMLMNYWTIWCRFCHPMRPLGCTSLRVCLFWTEEHAILWQTLVPWRQCGAQLPGSTSSRLCEFRASTEPFSADPFQKSLQWGWELALFPKIMVPNMRTALGIKIVDWKLQ